MEAAQYFLQKEIEKATKTIQRSMFDLIDDLRASDSDNVLALKSILQDDELAERFQLFQENKNKIIRKKILDSVGDLHRQLLSDIEKYDVHFNTNMEFKGIIKGNI